jgi:hypothetical protein
MSKTDATDVEGPFVGSRCLASPDGRWSRGTICRVNEDGTFNVELDRKVFPAFIMIPWCGVTAAEVSFNDLNSWPQAIFRLAGNPATLNLPGFEYIVSVLGLGHNQGAIKKFWAGSCLALFGIGADVAETSELTAEQAGALCLEAGISAKAADSALCAGRPVVRYLAYYFNSTRMGGRDPSEIGRPVTLADAFIAVGAGQSEHDDEIAGFLRDFETTQGIRLPSSLITFYTRKGAALMFGGIHPNNPEIVFLPTDGSELTRNLRASGFEGDFGLVLMHDFRACQSWAAVFDSGDEDASIYFVGSRGNYDAADEPWRMVAPTLGMFFWDLAQTGLIWHLQTGRELLSRIVRTDIGLALESQDTSR